MHQEEVRDCQWEAGRDFPSAKAELERPILPEHRDVLESRLARQPQDERLRAVFRLAPLAAQAQPVASPRAPLEHADEPEPPQAQ